MSPLSDSKSQAEIARRARSIYTPTTLSKKKAIAAHERFIKERQAHLKKRAALQRAVHKIQGDVAASLAKDNPVFRASGEALRKLLPRNATRKISYPSGPVVHPRISAGTISSFLAPPYLAIWTATDAAAPDSSAAADSNNGTFSSGATGDGSSHAGFAGVAAAYSPISNSPMGHFRPYIRYNYNYFDFSVLATAHSDGYIHAAVYDFNSSGNISVWPPAEQTVTVWQDGTAWYDGHDDSADYVWAGAIDVAFPLIPGHQYVLWVWSEVDADDAGTSLFASSFAQGGIQATCSFMIVVESQT